MKSNWIYSILIAGLVGLSIYLYLRPTTATVMQYPQGALNSLDSINKKIDSIEDFVRKYKPQKVITRTRIDSFYNISVLTDKDSLLNSLNYISTRDEYRYIK